MQTVIEATTLFVSASYISLQYKPCMEKATRKKKKMMNTRWERVAG